MIISYRITATVINNTLVFVDMSRFMNSSPLKDNTTGIPTCACSNVTQIFEKNDTTCREPCPESTDEESCGSKALDSWVVYCTRDDSKCFTDDTIVKVTAKPQFLGDDVGQPAECNCVFGWASRYF